MAPLVFVPDAQPKADHVGIGQKREYGPQDDRGPGHPPGGAPGGVDAGGGHTDRKVTEACHVGVRRCLKLGSSFGNLASFRNHLSSVEEEDPWAPIVPEPRAQTVY